MRLFIGIKFKENIVDGLFSLQNQLRKMVRTGRFPVKENLHLTLQFLGETPQSRMRDIVCELESVSKMNQPFMLWVGNHISYFGQVNPVRVVWVGIQGEILALLKLQKDVATKMQGLGFADEDHAYHPHVTLAREADFINRGVLLRDARIECGVGTFPGIRVEQISLFSSVVEQGKLVYRTLATVKLNLDKVE